MASTFSPILRIELIGTGDQSGTWGSTTNVNLGTLIEQAIAGTATIDVSSGNVTLTNYNGATDQARCAALRITGTPGTSRNIVAPSVSKIYVVANGSNAAVVLKTSTSTGLTIPSGEVYLAYYDTTSTDFRLVGRSASSTNTANTLVLRDGSGNFAAGTITATFVGDLAGTVNGAIGTIVPNTGTFTSITTYDNATIGNSLLDTLTVNATPTFNVAIPAASGGTGQSTYAVGDILYASTTTALSKLAGVATGNVLTSGGVGVAPAWGKVALAAAVSGTLPVANGGTGVTTSTGSGSVVLSTSPTLVTPVLGTPSSGTLTSCTGLPLTTGVTGTLPVANGGTGVTTSTGSGSNVLSTSPTLVTPILGTPTSVTLTNATGLPLTTGVTGTLPVANGGTGVTTSTGSGSNVLSTSPTLVTPILGTPSSGTLTSCTGLPLTTGVTGTLPAVNGGTGQSSYTVGDLVYASTTTALSKLADVATGNALISGGVGVAPSYGKIGLTTHVSGTLPVANGGTGAATLTGLAYGNGTSAFTAATGAQISTAIGSTAVTNATNATTATNIAGGAANRVVYQSGSGATTFVAAPSVAGTNLTWDGTSISWAVSNAASAGGVVYENGQTISANYTMTAGKNGSSTGDITIDSGVTVTIPSGSRWVIL